MTKNFIVSAIVMIFIFSAVGAYAASSASKDINPLDKPTAQGVEKTKDRASRAMNNILYGPLEGADNIDQTHTKGTQMEKCTTKTRSGVERGIARVVGGVWQLATFWYSDPGCVTSTKPAGASSAKAKKTSSVVK